LERKARLRRGAGQDKTFKKKLGRFGGEKKSLRGRKSVGRVLVFGQFSKSVELGRRRAGTIVLDFPVEEILG